MGHLPFIGWLIDPKIAKSAYGRAKLLRLLARFSHFSLLQFIMLWNMCRKILSRDCLLRRLIHNWRPKRIGALSKEFISWTENCTQTSHYSSYIRRRGYFLSPASTFGCGLWKWPTCLSRWRTLPFLPGGTSLSIAAQHWSRDCIALTLLIMC